MKDDDVRSAVHQAAGCTFNGHSSNILKITEEILHLYKIIRQSERKDGPTTDEGGKPAQLS